MAVGGTFSLQNKKLPGAYLSFKTNKPSGGTRSFKASSYKEAVKGFLMDASVDEDIIGKIEEVS